jgi:hypothetical protein
VSIAAAKCRASFAIREAQSTTATLPTAMQKEPGMVDSTRLGGVGRRCGDPRLFRLIGHILIFFFIYVTNEYSVLAGARISIPRMVQRGQPVNSDGNNVDR